MDSGPWRRKSVPPMPALIPISALRDSGKSPSAANSNQSATIDNNNGSDCHHSSGSDCGPCDRVKNLGILENDVGKSVDEEVFEEKQLSSGDEFGLERCRRRSLETVDENCGIDFVSVSASRDCQAPCANLPLRRNSSPSALRPARTERHRKSDRRRREHRSSLHHHHRRTTTNLTDIQEEVNQKSSKCPEPKQPRVNPIFVWVRQEDSRIVDVKCEDYDRRNRILLTKTAHGWRAIPRTETLTGTLEEKLVKTPLSTHHKHERSKNGPGRPPKSKKSRKRRESSEKHIENSTESESHLTEPEVVIENPPESPWDRVEDTQDIESHLPSHTITIPKRHRPKGDEQPPNSQSPIPEQELHNEIEEISDSVNTSIAQARTPTPESALETLLAAAEIAFNNQILEQKQKNEVLNQVELCDFEEQVCETSEDQKQVVTSDNVDINCDYNEVEDEENQFAEVLDKLEQSLQSPEDTQELEAENLDQHIEEEICPETPEAYEELLMEQPNLEPEIISEEKQEEEEEIVEETNPIDSESIVIEDEQPTDLSIHSKDAEVELEPQELLQEPMEDQPTDLSIKKHSTALTIEPICRPPSQNSETIQSPQPSGIPAVPPSPDILPSKNFKSVFLESLLSTSPKIALNPEITITRNQKEPLDLGKGRKSASPTVSCSEEAKTLGEPTPKRLKVEDITLKNLLHAEDKKAEVTIKPVPAEKVKPVIKDQSSRLLELLTSDTVPDPMTQLKQLLADPHINIPDPMLVPKDRLSYILAAPFKEIPRLLVTRPELRLPEALSHPNLMNDPDILVITMDQLHTILEKHHQPISLDEPSKPKPEVMKEQKIQTEKVSKPVQVTKHPPKPKSQPQVNHQAIANDYQKYIQNLQHQQQLMLQEAQMKHHQSMMRKPGLANDIDAATAASFNQMMWLPYLSQLEQAAQVTGNNTEFLKMLNAVFPNGTYPGPQELVPTMFGSGRFLPNNLQMPQPMDYNLEMSMWQEAMLRSKMSSENMPKIPSSAYRDLERKNNPFNNVKNKFYNGGHHNNLPYLNGHQNILNAQKSQLRASGTQQGFSSARTNPIMAEQQLIGMKNPFFRPNVQSLRTPLHSTSFQEKHHQNSLPEKKKEPLAEKFNLSQLSLKNNPFFTPKEKTKPSNTFLNDVSITKIPGEPFKPMDLSSQPKLKVRTNLMAGGFSFGREEAEVGSTTEDAMQNLHEANQNHHVWHPLFGK